MAARLERATGRESAWTPIFWLSPENLCIMAENVARGLSAIDPANADAYSARKEAYIAKIDACTDAIRRNLTGLEGRAFLVFHPAFGYFARDFGLVQVAVEEGGMSLDLLGSLAWLTMHGRTGST